MPSGIHVPMPHTHIQKPKARAVLTSAHGMWRNVVTSGDTANGTIFVGEEARLEFVACLLAAGCRIGCLAENKACACALGPRPLRAPLPTPMQGRSTTNP